MAEPTLDELQAQLAELQARCGRESAEAERFRKALDHAGDGIFISDPADGRFLEVNATASALTGYSRDELLEMRVRDLSTHPEVGLEGWDAFVQSVRDRGGRRVVETAHRHKDGTEFPVEVSIALLPVDCRELIVATVRDIRERQAAEALQRENAWLRSEMGTHLAFGEIVGSSPPLRAVLEQITLVAPTDANVLITGESGTGKELVARAIHRESPRRDRPMVKVNCGSIPRELFESEFFGHVQGAFTGAVRDREGRFGLADGGTLFLDEVGEIPLDLQPKLLRVLQEGTFEAVGDTRTRTVDVRVIAATNRDLKAEVGAGRFREDLYYRLSVFPLAVPPLRERCGDIPAMAEYFAREAAGRLGREPRPLAPQSVAGLCAYHWPGNVRELQNMIERAVIVSRGPHLVLDIPAVAPPGGPDGDTTDPAPRILTEAEMEALERRNIEAALAQAGGRIRGDGGAAELLQIKPTTLASRIKKLGIERGTAAAR